MRSCRIQLRPRKPEKSVQEVLAERSEGSPSETHFKLKLRDISFFHKTHVSRRIILKICTNHGRYTATVFI